MLYAVVNYLRSQLGRRLQGGKRDEAICAAAECKFPDVAFNFGTCRAIDERLCHSGGGYWRQAHGWPVNGQRVNVGGQFVGVAVNCGLYTFSLCECDTCIYFRGGINERKS